MKWITNKYFIAALILGLLGIWMFPAINKEHPKVSELKENFTPPEFKVLVESINLSKIRPEIRLSGLVKSDNDLTVRSQSSGKVKKTYVSRGDKVSNGSLLVELDEENFKITLEKAKANLQSENINFQSEKNLFDKGFTSKANLAQARVKLKEAKAQLDKAQNDFDHRIIKSDFEGEVNQIFVELGDFVFAGGNLVEILDLENLKIEAELLPIQLKRIQQSGIQPKNLIIKIDHPTDLENHTILGKLNFISKKANPNSRSYPIEVSISESKELFSLEQWISFTILLNEQMAYPIKRSLIFIDKDGDFSVDLVNHQNEVMIRKIQIIKDSGERVWVVGLNENELLIIRGAGFVDEGDRVTIVQK